MGNFIDRTGERFGRLVVLEQASSFKTEKRAVTAWLCRCDCGKTVIVRSSGLVSGNTKSCGCLHRETALQQGKASATHNETGTRLYRVWSNMKTRCYNKNNKNYARWGARGVFVCDEWLHDFSAFSSWARSSGYAENLTIDRINNDGPYCPENCHWVTPKAQANNTRKTRLISFNGKTQSLHEWAREYGMKVETLFYRLKRLPIGEALTTPIANCGKRHK